MIIPPSSRTFDPHKKQIRVFIRITKDRATCCTLLLLIVIYFLLSHHLTNHNTITPFSIYNEYLLFFCLPFPLTPHGSDTFTYQKDLQLIPYTFGTSYCYRLAWHAKLDQGFSYKTRSRWAWTLKNDFGEGNKSQYCHPKIFPSNGSTGRKKDESY